MIWRRENAADMLDIRVPTHIERMFERWQKQTVVDIPRWIWNCLPESWLSYSRRNLCREAIIAGTSTPVAWGQIQLDGPVELCEICAWLIPEIVLLEQFRLSMYLTSIAATLRTALMVGLCIPGVEQGIYSQTRTAPFTKAELAHVLLRAQMNRTRSLELWRMQQQSMDDQTSKFR